MFVIINSFFFLIWTELANVATFEDYLKLHYANEGLSDIVLDLCSHGLSKNEDITIQNVIDHPEIKWIPRRLLMNPSIQKDLNLDLILSQIDENTNRNKKVSNKECNVLS